MTSNPPPSDRHPLENCLPDDLHEVEQILQGIRPAPTRLTAEAVSEKAVALDPMPHHSVQRRPVATIVASWTCGAAVGGLVTFLFMSFLAPHGDTSRPDSEPHVSIAARDDHVPAEANVDVSEERPRDTPVATSEPSLDRPDAAYQKQDSRVTMLLDPLWNVRTSERSGDSSLRAGMHLYPDGDRWVNQQAPPLLASNHHRSETSPLTGSDPNPSRKPFSPSPGTTRQEFLADLLDEGT